MVGEDRVPLTAHGMLCSDSHDGEDVHSQATQSVGLWFRETHVCMWGEPQKCSLCHYGIDRTQLTRNGGSRGGVYAEDCRESLTQVLVY